MRQSLVTIVLIFLLMGSLAEEYRTKLTVIGIGIEKGSAEETSLIQFAQRYDGQYVSAENATKEEIKRGWDVALNRTTSTAPLNTILGANGLDPVTISFKDLKENGLQVASGRKVVVEEASNYAHLWATYFSDGTQYGSTASGNSFSFIAPAFDYTQGTDELDVKLTLSLPGCTNEYHAEITLVPPWQVEYKICIPMVEKKNVSLNLQCGIIGAKVVGPYSTNETYRYTGGASGKLKYTWAIDNNNRIIAEGQDANDVSDITINWENDAINASEAGTDKLVQLAIAKDYSDELATELHGVEVVDPYLHTLCNMIVKVYPPLKVNIDGPTLVCKDKPNLNVTYSYFGSTPATITNYVWSINGIKVGEGAGANSVIVDFNNKTLVPGFGNHTISVEATRTTPEGLIIKGAAQKSVAFQETPQIV